MLEKLRQRAEGLLSWGIVLLIGLSFALWGVTDYFGGNRSRAIAAKVNGEKISWQQVDAMLDRMSRQFANSPVDEAALKEQVRMALIQRTALLAAAQTLGFRVGDEQVAETLLKIPSFQVEGKFSKDRYLEVLNKAAYTDVSFRQELARDVLLSQLEQGLIQSSFVLPNEAIRLASLTDERRNFKYLVLPLQKYQAGIKVSKQDLQSHYDSHASQYVIPEQVSVEYVELSLEQLAKQQVVSEAALKSFYEEHQASYSAPERVRARHILIPFAASAKGSEEQASNKAQDLLKKIKEGADFAALAKTESVDTGSAKNGGDLGWFTRGQMVPEFEKAVFSLNKANELVGPVRTQYGYHLIQLIERKPAETRPFKEVRALVLEQVQREKAYALFAELSEKMAKLAFENPSLEPIAKALGLKIQETPLFSQSSSSDPNSASLLLKQPAVVEAAFSEPVLKQKNNSELLQIGEFNNIVLHVKKHQLAVQQTLEQVSKKIEQELIAERAKEKATEVANSLQKKLRAGEITPAALATQLNLPWVTKTNIARTSKEIDKAILAAAFQLPHRLEENKSAVKTFSLANGDRVLLMLDKVIAGDTNKTDENTWKAYQQGMIEMGAQLEFALYANRVLNEAKIEITEPPNL